MMLKKIIKEIRHNNTKGFSLIELIVIIAVLAMLTAILIPSMAGYLNNAKKATANANARTVYAAASAAIASCANTGGFNSISDISNSDISALKTGSEFEKQVAAILGDTFSGRVTIHIDGNHNIRSAEWSDNTMTGSYTPD